MAYPQFTASSSREEHDDGENESGERASLLDSIPAFRLATSLPAEAAASRSRVSQFLGTENVTSYGSISNRDNRNDRGVTRALRNGNDIDLSVGDGQTNVEEDGTDFVDIEEGRSRQLIREGVDDPTPPVETVDSDNDGNENPNNREGEQQQSTNETRASEEEQTPRDGAIGNITRRLRCLFSTITFPIVPLGAVVSLALLWVLYAATSLDLRKSCSHPLHSYAFMSLLLVAYIPNHAQVRSQIFHYSRERDGPVRPTRVRMYDQFFHTVCLLYVYSGATLVETCNLDLVDPNAETAFEKFEQEHLSNHSDPINTCEATCPNLYQALSVYVATLELFTFALILPLLFLPCIYLWFLQRATAEADAFARLQDQLQEEDALLSNGGVTTGEILNSLEIVKIISRQQPKTKSTNQKPEAFDGNEAVDDDEDSEQQQLWVLPLDADPNEHIGTKCQMKECCICMSEFDIEIVPEEDYMSLTSLSSSSETGKKDAGSDLDETDPLIKTKDEKESVSKEDTSSTIVRTRCGHLFHKECLKGWVGGMCSGNFRVDTQQDWMKRKARQIKCPLCREDLRPSVSTDSNTSNH